MKLAVFHPMLAEHDPATQDALRSLTDHLYSGDARAAVVVDTKPLRIAAYTDELDCVVLLGYDDAIGAALVERYRLVPGARLVAVNVYVPCLHVAEDLWEGPLSRGNFGDFHPVVGDFLSDDVNRLHQLRSAIGESEWARAFALGNRVGSTRSPVQDRDGIPLGETVAAMRLDGWDVCEPRAPQAAGLGAVRQRTAATLDAVLARAQDGAPISASDLERCNDAFVELYEAVVDEEGTDDHLQLSPEHQADLYLEAVKLAAIDHPRHTRWVTSGELRSRIPPVLRARLAQRTTPALALAAIQPALVVGDLATARDCYRRIERIPFLAGRARRWCDEALMTNPGANRPEVAREFLAGLPEEADPWNLPTSVPADRRWLLLASAYHYLTHDPRTTLAPVTSVSFERDTLKSGWGIRDTDSAAEVLTWLLNEGHTAVLMHYLDGRQRAVPAAASEDPEGIRLGAFLEQRREALERYRIRAWDLGRLIDTARSAHAAGYLDEEVAWEWLLLAGGRLRQMYTSWRDFGEDYILGAEFFGEITRMSPEAHVTMVRWLMDEERSPWQRVAWGGVDPTLSS